MAISTRHKRQTTSGLRTHKQPKTKRKACAMDITYCKRSAKRKTRCFVRGDGEDGKDCAYNNSRHNDGSQGKHCEQRLRNEIKGLRLSPHSNCSDIDPVLARALGRPPDCPPAQRLPAASPLRSLGKTGATDTSQLASASTSAPQRALLKGTTSHSAPLRAEATSEDRSDAPLPGIDRPTLAPRQDLVRI